jgi:hypothetical protein
MSRFLLGDGGATSQIAVSWELESKSLMQILITNELFGDIINPIKNYSRQTLAKPAI